MLTEAQAIQRLVNACAAAGSQAKFAALHGFTAPFISQVVSGHAPMTERLANALGLIRKAAYFPMREGA